MENVIYVVVIFEATQEYIAAYLQPDLTLAWPRILVLRVHGSWNRVVTTPQRHSIVDDGDRPALGEVTEVGPFNEGYS